MSNTALRIWDPLARIGLIPVLYLLVFFTIGIYLAAQPVSGQKPKTGEELYISACSNCHGLNGNGVPQEQLGFDVVPADFTDCSFASREPAADWVIVAHEGGPIRGFSRLMPAFGDALSYDELALIMEHVKAFCVDKTWPDGSFNLPRAMFTGKAYPEDEYVYTGGFKTEGDGEISNKLIYEKRFGSRNQFEVAVPFNWREGMSAHSGENEWNGGVGDIALGLKRVVHHSLDKGSIISVAGEVKLPTGNEDKGLGKGTAIFEPFITYGQILPSEFFLQTQVGLEMPFDTDRASQEAFWRATLGRSFTQGPFGRTWAPMMGVLGSRDLESGADLNWDIVPQMHFTLNTRQHIMMNIAVRVPVTDSSHRDTQILFYLLWDWFDGGFFDGW